MIAAHDTYLADMLDGALLGSQRAEEAAAAGGGGGRRSCQHFIHESCAARLSPQLCPICRTPFDACSAPFGGGGITLLGAKRVIAGTMRLLGQPAGETAPTSAVVPLLAAIFPVRRAALEVAQAAAAARPLGRLLLKVDGDAENPQQLGEEFEQGG